MRDRIKRAMARTWEGIGGDIAAASGGAPIDRETVIEVVLDADRLTTHGHDKEAAQAFYAMSREEQDKIAKEQFQYEFYE